MPEYSNYIGVNDVPSRPLIRRDVAALSNSLNKIDEKNKEALEKRNAIDIALSQVELNPAEDSWKIKYAQNIRDSIDAYAQYGDYSQALNAATMAAATALTSPELIGRMKAQADYKKFVTDTQQRTDISQDTKDWALSLNPYTYKDTFDEQGNLIGGTKWEATRTPVSTVPLSSLLDKAKSWTAVHKGGGVADVKFVDANGNLTSDYSKGVYGLAYKKDSQWEYLSEDDLRKALDSAIATTPGAAASLQQDYDVALWKYNKMTPEEKRQNIDSDIVEDGRILSPEEYLNKRVSPGLSAMAYRNSTSDISYGDGISNYYSTMASKAANEASSELTAYDPYSEEFTKPFANDITSEVGNTYARIISNYEELMNLFPRATKTKEFQNLVAKRNYEGVAEYLEKRINPNNKDSRRARAVINDLRDSGEEFNTYFKNSNGDREAFEFYSAINGHAPLPRNNKYTKRYNEILNSSFRVGTKNEAATIGYVTSDEDNFNYIAERLGIKNPNNYASWQSRGFTIDNYNGHKVIRFDRNNLYISDLMNGVMSGRNVLGHSIGGLVGTSGFLRYDKEGNIQNSRMSGDRLQNAVVSLFGGNPDTDYQLDAPTGLLGSIGHFNTLGNLATEDVPGIDILNLNTPVQTAERKTKDFIKGLTGDTVTYEQGSQYNSTIARMDALNRKLSGSLSNENYNDVIKYLDDNETPQLVSSVSGAYNMWADDEEGQGSLMPQNEEEKEDIRQLINTVYANKPNLIRTAFGTNQGKTGTYFLLYSGVDDKGKPKGNTRTIFVEGLGNNEASRRFQDDTITKARAALVRARSIRGRRFTLDNGAVIHNVTNDGGQITYKGRTVAVPFDQLQNMLAGQYGRQEARAALRSGQIYTNEGLVAAAESIVQDMGYSPNDPNYKTLVLEQIQEIKNY